MTFTRFGSRFPLRVAAFGRAGRRILIRGGDDSFGPVRIEPIDRPAVADLKLVARPPGATATRFMRSATPTSRWFFCPRPLELRLSASEPLTSAKVMTKTSRHNRSRAMRKGDGRISPGVEHDAVANAGTAIGLAKRPGLEALLFDDRIAHRPRARLTLRSGESANASRRTPCSAGDSRGR